MRISDWSSDVCSSDLALLLAYAGFTPLHWGLFALLAAAEQWLAWRERSLAVVPTTSLALSILLLALWPDALASWFAVVGIAPDAIAEIMVRSTLAPLNGMGGEDGGENGDGGAAAPRVVRIPLSLSDRKRTRLNSSH